MATHKGEAEPEINAFEQVLDDFAVDQIRAMRSRMNFRFKSSLRREMVTHSIFIHIP